MKAGSFFIHLAFFLLALVILLLLYIFVFPLAAVAPEIKISSLLAAPWTPEVVDVQSVGKAVLLREVSIGRSVVFAEVALSAEERNRGLSERESLSLNHGMLFVFPEKSRLSFWMKDMLIPLDIIWISEGRVVGFDQNVPPPEDGIATLKSYPAPSAVDWVLEVNAGFIAENKISVGDEVVVK